MKLDDEVSLNQVFKIFIKRWRYLVILALVFSAGALIKHKYFPIYPAKGKLIIQDVKNSHLQSLLSQVTGTMAEGSIGETKDENSVTRAVSLLDTQQFFLILAERIIEINSTQKNNYLNKIISRYKGQNTESDYIYGFASYLNEVITFTPQKDGQLLVKVTTGRKELSVLVLNETLLMAKDHLTNRELKELTMAEKYFNNEIDIVRARLDIIESKTIHKMQKTQIISVDMEKGETSKYQSELKKNINDIQIQIEENNKRLTIVKSNNPDSKSVDNTSIGKYSGSSLVKKLEDENSELNISLLTYQSYLKDLEKQNKGLVPFQYEMEKMKANYNLEYKVYESLRESLAKIGLQKTYVKNKIEILENERVSNLRSSPGLMIMILISIMLSQVCGLGAIYLYELLKS